MKKVLMTLLLLVACINVSQGQDGNLKVLGMPINSNEAEFISGLKSKGWNDWSIVGSSVLSQLNNYVSLNSDMDVNTYLYEGKFLNQVSFMAIYAHNSKIAYIVISIPKCSEDFIKETTQSYITQYGEYEGNYNNGESYQYLQWVGESQYVEIQIISNYVLNGVNYMIIGYGDSKLRKKITTGEE